MVSRLFKISLLVISFYLVSCAKKAESTVVIYQNDFESNDLQNITNGAIETFNGSKVLGRYNNDGFKLTLENLPKHDLIEVTFDLYIHDSWDGNKSGDFGRNGPDIWNMLLDGVPYINTTFSNSDCGDLFLCNPQSYPANYINSTNKPKTGAYQTNLPGACSNASLIGGSTLYKITKLINHKQSRFTIECRDALIQTNTKDPKCDESWSVDNIKINAIQL